MEPILRMTRSRVSESETALKGFGGNDDLYGGNDLMAGTTVLAWRARTETIR